MTSNRRFTRYASLGAFFVAATIGAQVVHAADAKYKKKEIEVQGGTQTELTKPKEPVKEQQKQTGPVLTVDAFVGQQQNKIVKVTMKQIRIMQDLIRSASEDDPQKPDYYFRLGELYAETQRAFGFQARGLDQKVFEAQQAKNTAQANSLKQKQQQLEKESEKWSVEAVKSYVQASKYPKYNRMDEVLFRLAYLLQAIKKEDQAREFFHRLIKDYPQSKYVPNAYLSFAEFYFQKGEMENALKFYEKVEQFPGSSVFGFALYKKGWVEINLGNFKGALEIFVRVIQLCKDGKITKNQAGPLEKEAKKDLVKAYARTPGASPDKAWDFFQRMGGDYAPKMLEALAELYWEQGMFPESSKIYRKIITLNAEGKESYRLCEWQNKILRNTLSGGNKKDQVQELKRLGNVYEVMSKKEGIKKDVFAECKNSYHDTGKELALIWHKEAQRTKNADTYQLAGMVYKEFLGHFTNEKDSAEMTFYYGEILWQMSAWKEAAETYTKVVELDPKGKYVKESAYAAVLAWKNALNISDSGDEVDKDKGNKDLKAAADSRVPEEDDWGLRYVHQVRAGRAGTGEDQVSQGARVLRLQPLRRGHQVIPGHRRPSRDRRIGHLLGQPASRLSQHSQALQGTARDRREVPGQPGPHEGSGIPQADGLAQDRQLGGRGEAVRKRQELQGMRYLVRGGG